MANDYIDYFEINGVEVHIQDYGRDKPNGVPVLDLQGKLPTKYIPDNYANELLVSPEDPYGDSLTDWVGKLASDEFQYRGKNWTQGTGANTTYNIQDLVYANNLWVCAHDNKHGIWWSEDGKNWTQGTGADTMQHLVYANGLWVCGSSGNGLWWSEDGKNWTQGTGANTTYNMQYLVYANDLWVCGSARHGLWWSTDGKNWIQGTGANTTYSMQYLVYANGLWVCGSMQHGVWWTGLPVWTPELA